MRAILILLAGVISSTGAVTSAIKPIDSKKITRAIDPIITGKQITKRQYQNWLIARQLAKNCPDCVAQPFPNNISE